MCLCIVLVACADQDHDTYMCIYAKDELLDEVREELPECDEEVRYVGGVVEAMPSDAGEDGNDDEGGEVVEAMPSDDGDDNNDDDGGAMQHQVGGMHYGGEGEDVAMQHQVGGEYYGGKGGKSDGKSSTWDGYPAWAFKGGGKGRPGQVDRFGGVYVEGGYMYQGEFWAFGTHTQ